MDEGLIRQFMVDELEVLVFKNQETLAKAVANEVGTYLQTLTGSGKARAILATGNSQISFLKRLAKAGGIQWDAVTLFHMDEYLGLPASHSASFRRYMRERVESLVNPEKFHYLEGDALEPIDECERYARELQSAPIQLCCLGVGENGHIAFNDPPVANGEDPRWVKIVKLDTACRMQQVNEGHFPSLDESPEYALTLTIPALLSANKVVCVAPETRKAEAVRDALQGPIETRCPASFLRTKSGARMFIDEDSSQYLDSV